MLGAGCWWLMIKDPPRCKAKPSHGYDCSESPPLSDLAANSPSLKRGQVKYHFPHGCGPASAELDPAICGVFCYSAGFGEDSGVLLAHAAAWYSRSCRQAAEHKPQPLQTPLMESNIFSTDQSLVSYYFCPHCTLLGLPALCQRTEPAQQP